MPTEERLISVDELIAAAEAGKLEEAFGTGTAAVITPVNKLRYKDKDIIIGNGEVGFFSQRLYETLTAIQRGNTP